MTFTTQNPILSMHEDVHLTTTDKNWEKEESGRDWDILHVENVLVITERSWKPQAMYYLIPVCLVPRSECLGLIALSHAP